jgi:hypothetical protein
LSVGRLYRMVLFKALMNTPKRMVDLNYIGLLPSRLYFTAWIMMHQKCGHQKVWIRVTLPTGVEISG